MKNLVKIAILFFPLSICAQSNVGVGTNSPASSAQLDVYSSTKGLLIPRVALTTILAPTPVSAPEEGLIVWNTNEAMTGGYGKGFYYWEGSRWQALANTSDSWSLTGNIVDTAIHFIGTTNDAGLMFRVSNQPAGGIFPDGRNLFLGLGAGQYVRYKSSVNQGEFNTYIGDYAGNNDTSGRSNTFVGASAGSGSIGSFGNTFLGRGAGGTTSGSNNIAVGVQAGFTSSGSRNISIGTSAGHANDGNDNLMIGHNVGSFIQGGSSNIWIGSNAATGNFNLNPKFDSHDNVIIGDSAVYRINGAESNVIIGKRAGFSSSEGDFNVFVGDNAGDNNSTGSRSTYVGSKAKGSLNNLLNASAIGANAYVTSSNSMVLGSVFGENGATSMTNVGIGINNPTHRLWVRYDQGSTGIIPHYNSVQVLERADSNVFLSFLGERETGLLFANPNSNIDGGIFYNSSPTTRGLQFRTGGNNTQMVVTDDGNIGIRINDPSRRLWVRHNDNSTGITPHGNSIQVLEKSGGNEYLSFLGDAEYERGLLFAHPTSSADAGIMYNSSATPRGLQFRTGSNSVKMVITSDSKIGIGTSAPDYRLHVVTNDAQNFGYREGIVVENIAEGANNTGEAAISFKNRGPDGTGESQWIIGLNQTRNLSFTYGTSFVGGSATKMYIDSTGDVGIGTTTPSQKLHVNGNIFATGTITPSDIRFKKNITVMASLLPRVLALQPMIYEWRSDEFPQYDFDDKQSIGVMAQQMEAMFPELVVTDKNGYKAVDYSKLSVVLLKALQEQQNLLQQQQKDIEQLRENIKSIEHRLK